jgi:hypothetical protein
MNIDLPADLLAPYLHHALTLPDLAADGGQPLDAPEILPAGSHQRQEVWHPTGRHGIAQPEPTAWRR